MSSLVGCQKMPEPAQTLDAASEKFLKICKEEFKYNIVLKSVGETMWIYAPMKEPILDLKSSEKQSGTKEPEERLSVKYLDGEFKTPAFAFEYDIDKVKSYPKKDPGYGLQYSENYRERHRNILMALQRSYFDLGEVPGDVTYKDPQKQDTHEKLVESYVMTAKPPRFFVFVVADISAGVEIEDIFYFQDLKRYATGDMPEDEFTKRYVSESRGSQGILADVLGKHLDLRDIVMSEFLTKQIMNRINFKYGQSSFSPSEDAEKEIMSIIAETLKSYDFQDFHQIDLHNLKLDSKFQFDKPSLLKFLPEQ
jgi:hypothetical protein